MNVYSVYRNRLFVTIRRKHSGFNNCICLLIFKVSTLHFALTRVIPEKKKQVKSLVHHFLCVIFNYWQRQSLYVTPCRVSQWRTCYSTSRMLRYFVLSPCRVEKSVFYFRFLLVATGPITRTVSRLRLSFILRTCIGPLVAAVAAVLVKRLVQLMRYSRDE